MANKKPTVKKTSEYMRAWREKNRERVNAYAREYRRKHPERTLATKNRWRVKNGLEPLSLPKPKEEPLLEHEIITYEKAKLLGMMKYFTGKPCGNGHIAERYVKGKSCVECNKQRVKSDAARRQANEKKNTKQIIPKPFDDGLPSFIVAVDYSDSTYRSRDRKGLSHTTGIVKEICHSSITLIDFNSPYCLPKYKALLAEWDKRTPLGYYCGINNIPAERFTRKIQRRTIKSIKGEVIDQEQFYKTTKHRVKRET